MDNFWREDEEDEGGNEISNVSGHKLTDVLVMCER